MLVILNKLAEFFNLDYHFLLFFHVNACTSSCTDAKAFSKNFVDTFSGQILLYFEVISESNTEVAVHHEVADWLHDIPTQQMEGSIHDTSKLCDVH